MPKFLFDSISQRFFPLEFYGTDIIILKKAIIKFSYNAHSDRLKKRASIQSLKNGIKAVMQPAKSFF